LEAQINPIQDFPANPDYLAVQIKSKCFDFTTKRQLLKVSKSSISIDFLPLSFSKAFLNSIPNVFSLLQALWQARWPFLQLRAS
jgi:hypothetical protein